MFTFSKGILILNFFVPKITTTSHRTCFQLFYKINGNGFLTYFYYFSPITDGSENLTSPTDGSENPTTPTDSETPYCRPTLSTEDVNSSRLNKQRVPPPTQFMLTYQYVDPHCRYILRPSTGNSGEYLVSIGQPSRSKSDHQQFLGNNSSSEHIHHQIPSYRHPPQYNHVSQHQMSQNATLPPAHQTKSQVEQKSSKSRHCHGHSCNPCVGQKKDKSNGDNVSLDAYDLASPCCDPHCVPTR